MSTTTVNQTGSPIDQAIVPTDMKYRKWLKEPWKIYIQNVRGLITENSSRARDMLREYTKMEKMLILNITETWLDEEITTDADIENYKTFRSYRKGEIRGVTIYINEKINRKH